LSPPSEAVTIILGDNETMQVVDADQFTDSTDEDYDENPQIVALEK
jgi:hypothetical protein